MGWSKVIKPKEEGGLGIQAAKAKNIALLSKLNWRMCQEKNTPWAKVMINKYCSSSRRRARDPDKLPSSPSWTAIKLEFPTFSRGICWGVGNGLRINVWSDSSIKGCSLRELIVGPLKPEENNLVVSDLHQNHEWKWKKLSFDLLGGIKDKIKATPMQLYGCRKESILWKHFKDGEFSTN